MRATFHSFRQTSERNSPFPKRTEEKEKSVEPVLSAMLTLSATFEKLKTGDRDVVFTQVHLQEVKGLWPNPRFNLGNGCVHVVWMKRSVRSVCNKRRHVVVFAKQALIADAAPAFLRFAWPAVASQMVRLRRVFTAAREEITRLTGTNVNRPVRPNTAEQQFSVRFYVTSFWGMIYETPHY